MSSNVSFCGGNFMEECNLNNVSEILEEMTFDDENDCTDVCSDLLLQAIETGKYDICKSLLDQGADPNCSYNGNKLIHFVCMQNNKKLLSLILEYYPDITSVNFRFQTALDITCSNHFVDCTKTLLHHIINVSNLSRGWKDLLLYNALCKSIETEFHPGIQMLLDEGVSPNLNLSHHKGTALHIACEIGCFYCVELLLKYGANTEVICKEFYQTPISLACRSGNDNIVRLLIESGADVNHQSDECSSPLIIACNFGWKNIVELLLDNRADPHTRNPWGYTSLYMASDSCDIIALLIENNVSVDVSCGEKEETALHIATISGSMSSVIQLLEAGANVDKETAYEESPIWLASSKGHLCLVKLFIRMNCNLNCLSDGGHYYAFKYSPLEILIGNGNFDLAETLINAGCSLQNHSYFKHSDKGPSEKYPWVKLRPEPLYYLEKFEFYHNRFMFLIKNPKSLLNISRIIIRKNLSTSKPFTMQLESLEIPLTLKNYLRFIDL